MGFFTKRETPPPPRPPVQAKPQARPTAVARPLTPRGPVAVATSPAPGAANDAIGGVLGELIRTGSISPAKADEVRQEATRLGRRDDEILSKRNLVSKADLYTAITRLTPAEQARIGLTIRTTTELPEWDALYNDIGGSLGATARDQTVAVVGGIEDNNRRTRANEKPRCFILTTQQGKAGQGYSTAVSQAIKAGFLIRATLLVASQDILNVVWSQWESRHGGPRVEGASVSDMHKMFDTIISDAYRRRASDVHITAGRGDGKIEFRLEGDLIRQPFDITSEVALSLCESAFNTMRERGSSKKDFDPRKMLDAVIDRPLEDGRVRLRYAGLPIAPNGYNVTLRLIPIGVHQRPKSLLELGYAPDQDDALNRSFSRSSGLILFCGTTGSGKSTSMANRLSTLHMERPTKKIRTVEEPIEYIIEGADQTAVERDEGDTKGLAFQRTLAALMRADPDILMVGEIRDAATARLAVNGVQSGHLLISTLHSAAAPTCYDRLAGLEIPRLDLATVDLVSAFVFQCLVQTLCEHCKIPAREMARSNDPVIKGNIARLRKVLDENRVPGARKEGEPLDGIFFRNIVGCPQCENRGITGRTVCAEVFRPTPPMLRHIASGDSRELWSMWRSQINQKDPDDMTGRRAMEHAMWKMAKGLVSPLEVETQFRYLDEPIYEVVQ